MVQDQIKKGQLAALPNFMGLGAVAKQAHPTRVAAGVAAAGRVGDAGAGVSRARRRPGCRTGTLSARVQGRLARLQCWALPVERDEEFRRAVAFAEQGLAQAHS